MNLVPAALRMIALVALGFARPFAWGQLVVSNVNDLETWPVQSGQMRAQIVQVRALVNEAKKLVTYAGNPRDAVNSFSNLTQLSKSLAVIVGPKGTMDSLRKSSRFFANVEAAQTATTAMLNDIAGLEENMAVFGQSQPRNTDTYLALAGGKEMAKIARHQLNKQSDARDQILKKLDETWRKLGTTSLSETRRRALLTQIVQLQAQAQLLEGEQVAFLAQAKVQALSEKNEAEASRRGQEEVAHAEGAVLEQSYHTRREALRQRAEAALQPVPQSSVDWSEKIKTYWQLPGGE